MVQCSRCAQQFNSKSGAAVGALHIVLYSLVVFGLLGGVFLVVMLAVG